MTIDRAGLAEFLRRRRESLQPEDVGLPRGPRRRTSGLRREDHCFLSRMFTSGAREIATLRGRGSRAAQLAELLLERSEEFRTLWEQHEVGLRPDDGKNLVHPELGRLELNCQTLVDSGQSHYLHIFTAIPGSESYQKLQLLAAVGDEA
ncbi:hypothetical protein ODJ79_32165 [Actinoplanes sp. KI2]|uniref:MmyB family transcriptional regulator n=1 Tax=Actinoplanes sp. KI2 TaxID=2983315 RepID=UPI0021D5D12F|nr:hypothetical protein [Actinoplanes sp. KI2]MCU7728390.1 hypothetical protein [Actinoplanes sp. KI2]